MRSSDGLLNYLLPWAAQVGSMQAVPMLLMLQDTQQVADVHDRTCLAPPIQVGHEGLLSLCLQSCILQVV